ncbi:MAG: hypothetical protein ACKVQS_06605 [Fimbriimonadaceae bacterium]
MPPFLFLLSILLLAAAIATGRKSKRPFLKTAALFGTFLLAGTTVFTATYLISPPKHIAAFDEPIQKSTETSPRYQSSMPQPEVNSSKYPTPILKPVPKLKKNKRIGKTALLNNVSPV